MTNVRTITMDNDLPTLYLPWPQCGHCGAEVMLEDGTAWCVNCRVQWDKPIEDRPATPDSDREGTDVACAIVGGEQQRPPVTDEKGVRYEPGPLKPCILPSGHEGDHICPYDVVITYPDPVPS